MARRERVMVSLDASQVQLLQRLAALQGRSVSATLREMVESYEPALERVVDLLEQLAQVEDENRAAVAAASRRLEEDLLPEVEGLASRWSEAIRALEAVAADPRPVTRGSGFSPLRPGSAEIPAE